MNISNIDANKLVALVLDQNWHKECEIIQNHKYRDGSEVKVLIKYPNEHQDTFLRYSKGHKQCYFWDVYGNDFNTVELAILALSKAPIPMNYRKSEYPVKFNL